jgi:polar amino acid transport system substrate-binding protein
MRASRGDGRSAARAWLAAAAAAVLLAGLAACDGDPAPDPAPSASGTPAPSASAAPSAGGADTCDPPADASFDPLVPLPPPGRMPAGTTMAEIQERGRLRVGTAGDKPLLAARDTRTGELGGIDVDLAREVARAIFGDPSRVEFRTIAYADRVPLLQAGEVDMVAHSMTMTCARWQDVNFSSEYFNDGQRVLVRQDSPAKEVEDLAGSRICVASGTTTIDNLRALNIRGLEIVPVREAADCLVLFQDGAVEAITSNEIILLGYTSQDPYAKIVGRNLSQEPRGLAFPKESVDLTRFTNAVLQRMRDDGSLTRILEKALTPVGKTAEAPAATTGRVAP